MASGKTRSTRRLCTWMIEQVSSGKYPGLVWDDEAKTMFRIPWKHAGKQDFRSDEDAAIFKAWAEFKGKLSRDAPDDPAMWKTRLRCALNKSPEFTEVTQRAQLDISEPYKVYRLVPLSQQGLVVTEKKCREKPVRRQKRRSSSSSESDGENAVQVKQMKEEPLKQFKEEPLKQFKEEPVASQLCVEDILLGSDIITTQIGEPAHQSGVQGEEMVNEIQLDVRFETVPPPGVLDSFHVSVQYLGQEVLKREIPGRDVRITYLPSSLVPPTPASLMGGFPRVMLPEPPSKLPPGPELQALSTLLPYMEKGVVLTSTDLGVYGKRFCQGRVFWTGPHAATPGLHKMERNTEPVLLFSKDAFKQQLEQYHAGGELPQCGITLCFGEELTNVENPSSKLIIVQISLPWAQEQVQNTCTFLQSIDILQSLASQSPEGEFTLNLVPVPLAL